MEITAKELRQKWLDFYKSKEHAVIQSSSLIPENDPTVLFTTAGMHPLVPYLMGAKHPAGRRLANVQKCVRTGDIDEVGDNSHCTFFEMLGNWSLGDYFKKEQIAWSFEFLTDKKYLGIPKSRLAVSVFEGDSDCPKDEESIGYWLKCGIPKERIFYLPKANNWWGPAGTTGPCGPDTEMFYVADAPDCSPNCSPACDCGKYLEIWNDVFMEYNKTADGKYEQLKQKNVDTGMGLERTLAVLNGKKSVYDIDLFTPIITCIENLCDKKHAGNERPIRIIADHIRTAVFMLGDEKGITPSNVDQGYVLRRLIRRAIRYAKSLYLEQGAIVKVAETVIGVYKDVYKEIANNKNLILSELTKEEERFEKTLKAGLKEFDKLVGYVQNGIISGKACFKLYDTYGFPIEMTEELAKERGLKINREDFEKSFAEHQAKSQAGAQGKFTGGLADNAEATARLHTATHLMHTALKKVLSNKVAQRGSNITEDRLRFDFSFDRKVEDIELREVERLVNEAIAADVPIVCNEMTVDDARQKGAIGLFENKYGEKVRVYTMGNYSIEICGGPHASRTGELGKFSIAKEESSSAGVRRIKAILK